MTAVCGPIESYVTESDDGAGIIEFAWTRLNQQGTGLVAAGAEPE
jgi:hypothetical protein